MASRAALAWPACRRAALGTPGASVAGAAALLGLGSSSASAAGGGARPRRSAASQCEEPGRKWRRPLGGTSGSCPQSAVRFYAARSRKPADSSHCFAIAERLHQFAVVDGLPDDGDGGAACAKLCASRLTPYVARSFQERVRRVPLDAAADAEGRPFADGAAAAAAYWADALTSGFGQCDQAASQEAGACGALLCVVADSGVYIASAGLGRAVIGTEVPGGEVLCDEASCPHCLLSEAEGRRWADGAAGAAPGQPPPPAHLPTRFLGGLPLKQAEPRLVASPDVVRHQHSDGRRFVVLGSPGLWDNGPRLPVQWAVEAYRSGRSPADELVARSRGEDVVAVVVVLPAGLGRGDGRLPAHGELLAADPEPGAG